MYTKQLAQFISTVYTGLLLSTSITWAEDKTNEGISPQPLTSALAEFAEQSGLQLVYLTELTEGIETQGAEPTQISEEALDQLLADTGLRYEFINDRTVSIEPKLPSTELNAEPRELGNSLPASKPALVVQNQALAPQNQKNQTSSNDEQFRSLPLEEIIVTGTSIRGVIPESSPLAIYDSVYIQNTGALTLEQFITKLPQNNNTLTEVGVGAGNEFNSVASNSVDLRGLGVGTTLVLLNGRRMAPSSSGRSPDISFIPLSLIERVEVLTDGASAIYGADAIGGVVNIVLKDESSDRPATILSYGSAGGDMDQYQIDQSLSWSWEDSRALVSASFMERSDLDASDRSYADIDGPYSLVPEDRRNSVFATLNQSLPGDVGLTADFLYSTRDAHTTFTGASGADLIQENESDHEQIYLNLGINKDLNEKATAEILATYAASEIDQLTNTTNRATDVAELPFSSVEENTTLEITGKVGGDLLELPSGVVKFSVGAGYSEEEYDNVSDSTLGGILVTDRKRDTSYMFGEVFVPIISEDQGVAGLRRLELSIAGRYTDYSDFGGNVSPKAGVLWSPFTALNVRATFGVSFRPPFLSQLDPTNASNFLFSPSFLGVPDIWSTDDSTVLLLAIGPGNPRLQPEEAETTTFGFDFSPTDIEGLSISATYFKIDYTDRIAEPDGTNGLQLLVDPTGFLGEIILNPDVQLVTGILTNTQNIIDTTGSDLGDPAVVASLVTVVADDRLLNLALSNLDGVDLTLDYSSDTAVGEFFFGFNATRIFDYVERRTALAPEAQRTDVVLSPAAFKGRAYFGLTENRWNVIVNINYVDGYDNPFNATQSSIDSWTTADIRFSYEFGNHSNELLSSWSAALNIQNISDEDPPFVATSDVANIALDVPIGFDPANANPLGRFINIQVVKRW